MSKTLNFLLAAFVVAFSALGQTPFKTITVNTNTGLIGGGALGSGVRITISNGVVNNSILNGTTVYGGVGSNDITANTMFMLGMRGINGSTVSLYPTADTTRSIQTLMGLNTALVTTNSTVEVRGYYTTNFVGGGTFYYAPFSATNRFDTFQAGSASFVWRRLLTGQPLNVHMFGALGDGAAQDYEALQSAVSYAVTNRLSLRIPAGTYLLTNKLVIPVNSSGWSIYGDGAGSILKQTASSGSGTPIFEFAGGGIDRFSVSDLALEWSDVGGVPASGWKNVGFMFAWDGTSDKGTGVYNFTLSGLAFTFGFRCLGNYDLSATSSSGVNVWGMTLKSSRATYMAGGAVLLSNAGSGGSPNVTIADFHVNGTTYGQPVATSPFIYSDPHFFCDSATGWSFHGVELNNVASSVPVWQFTGPASQIVFDNCRTEAMLLATNRAMMEFDNVGVTIGSFDFSNINVRTNIAGTLIKFDNSNTATAAHELVISSLDHQGNPTYPTVNLQSGASLTLVDAAVGTLAFVGNLPPVAGATTYGRSGPMLNGAANWRFQPATVGTNYTPVASNTTNVPNWFRLTCTSNTLMIQAITGAVAGSEYVFDLSSANGTTISWISPDYQMSDDSKVLAAGDRRLIRALYTGTNFVQSGGSPAWGGGNRVLTLNAAQSGIAGVDFSIGNGANSPTNRWRWATDGTTESGSNAGSNLALTRFSDDGTNIGTPVTFNRATGATALTSLNVTGAMTQNSVAVALKPATETLTYSTTNVTITAGKGPMQRSLLTVTNNFQLLWSGLTDNDGGIVHMIPATTNVTVLISAPGRAAGSSAATATGSTTLTITGATNGWVEMAWSVVSVGGTNRVSVNLGAY